MICNFIGVLFACPTFFLLANGLLADAPSNTFTIAAYNVENWLSMERHGIQNQPKPQEEQDAVAKIICEVRPDVLGLMEIGTRNNLQEVENALSECGLDYTHSAWVRGRDEVRHVALLSRYPIIQRFSRTDYSYLLRGKRMRISRGILDVMIEVNPHYQFRAVVVHLKSKRNSELGNQAVMRFEEAQLLRKHIGKALKKNPDLNLILMGDLNDTPQSKPIRTVIGEQPFTLFDLVPKDTNGRQGTHYWRQKHKFSRIDYLLTSAGMSNEYVIGSAKLADYPAWMHASDHLAIHAKFYANEMGETTRNLSSKKCTVLNVSTLGITLAGSVILGVLFKYRILRRRN